MWLMFGALAASGAHADAVLDWNDVALAEVTASGQLPPDGARTMAMVHVAIFDAVNAIDRLYDPVALREREPADASTDAAIASASHAVLVGLFPARGSALAAPYAAALARIPDGHAKQAGIALGQRAADACLELRAGDGTGAPNRYTPHTAAGVYVPTSLPVSSEWPDVKPWSMESASQFRPAPPPKLTSDAWARDLAEVERLGAKDSTARSAS
jgi:hypothetical protein